MSPDSISGCFGKLPLAWMLRLRANTGAGPWDMKDCELIADGAVSHTSIDSIRLEGGNIERSAALALLHAFNDLLASGVAPKGLAASIMLNDDCKLEDFEVVSKAILTLSDAINVRVSKFHSLRSGDVSSITFAVVGSSVPRADHSLSTRGKVFLVGDDQWGGSFRLMRSFYKRRTKSLYV